MGLWLRPSQRLRLRPITAAAMVAATVVTMEAMATARGQLMPTLRPTTAMDMAVDTAVDTVALTDTTATDMARGQLMLRPTTAMDTAVDTAVMAVMDTTVTATASKPRRPILNRSRNLSQPNFAIRQMQSSIIDCKPLCQIFKSCFAPMCLNSL